DGSLTGGVPVPAFAPERVLAQHEAAEAEALRRIQERIRNEPGRIEPDPVIAVIRRQLETWRWERQRKDQDPEPSQWASLILAVKVPARPDFAQVVEIRRTVHALPAQVLGVLNDALFQRAEIGTVALFTRMSDAAMEQGATAAAED